MSQFQTEVTQEQIFVASIDFDGCSDNHESREAIIEHIALSCQSIKDLKKIILMIGSLRQSLRLDIINAKYNSTYPNYISCTSIIEHFEPRLKELFPRIEIIVDPYLLFDSFQQLEHGTTFRAMQKLFAEIDHKHIKDYDIDSNSPLHTACHHEESDSNLFTSNHFTDCSKISIIYPQLHHIASQYTDKQIVMHFYDDKINILNNLYHFYIRNLQWIPKNLSLYLFKQMAITEHKPIPAAPILWGNGPINHHYHHQLLELAKSLNWQSAPEWFNDFELMFQKVFLTPSLPEKFTEIIEEIEPSPYENIKIPSSFDNEIEKQAFCQFAREKANQIFDELLTIEKDFFTDFLNSLDDFNDFKEEYHCCYQILKLKQSKQSLHIIKKINELESILELNLGHDYERIMQEAQDYAEAHLTYDQRILDCTAFYHQFLQDLIDKVSKTPVLQVRIVVPIAIKGRVHTSLFKPDDTKNTDFLPMSPR